MTEDHAGMFGESEAPDTCPECGASWTECERLHTGDSNGIGGWEDWMYCAVCRCETFYPVVARPQITAPPGRRQER